MRNLKYILFMFALSLTLNNVNAATCKYGDSKLYFTCTTSSIGIIDSDAECTIGGTQSGQMKINPNYTRPSASIIEKCDTIYYYLGDNGVSGFYASYEDNPITSGNKIDAICIKNALEEFRGVGRRFEYLGEYKGAYLFDDFAHHPTEIMATYNSAKSIKHNESWAIFQSHTFSRTYEHMEEFADILAKFDNIIICDIYPAREKNIWNVKEDTLVNLINTKNKNVIHISSYEEIATYLKEKIKQNDLVITIGAGPINKVAKILLEK